MLPRQLLPRQSTALLVLLGSALGSGAQTSAPRVIGPATQQTPHPIEGGFDLPNGWRITPAGKPVAVVEDLVLNMVVSPDGKVIVATHSGYNPHGLDVLDVRTQKLIQHIDLKTTWFGMAWSPDGRTLYVSGGNADGGKEISSTLAPIYEFSYSNGRLSGQPTGELNETIDKSKLWWAGVVHHPTLPLLYAANRGTDAGPSEVVVFNTKTGKIVTRIPAEVNPYQVVLSKDGGTLFVSNWASQSVTVIDTARNRVSGSIRVGSNPNDMKLSTDGRLFVACSNDNMVYVIDAASHRVLERLSATLTPLTPEGSTPDALAIDEGRKLLYVADADNNSMAVIDIHNREHSAVIGFVPTGWYPSALVMPNESALFIGNSKGEGGHADLRGPTSPLASKWDGDESVKTLQKSSIEWLPLEGLRAKLAGYTRQVVANTPYNDGMLEEARTPLAPSILPQAVGADSPVKHVIFIIKENRTYDQEFGDLPHANGDSRLTIFGQKVTPNQHALAEEFVTFDNLYCDGEVSVDGHSWSNSAYATDFNERLWPPVYAGRSNAKPSAAYIPSAGHMWDLARRKGLTYRSYGEYAVRASSGVEMHAAQGVDALWGHVAPDYRAFPDRDTKNVKVFLREFDGYEKNFDSTDADQRLPNYIVMSMWEDHTQGTRPGSYTPQAMVADNDYAIGQLVDRVTHSRYWPTTAIFIIEDDAQDGPDHVDARRTVGLVISPYTKRHITDSTLYSTSSMLRSMELLLGLPPMSQYDAAAMPMYAAFTTKQDLTAFSLLPPQIDLDAKNTLESYGARASMKMDFSDLDRAPMHALNEILWKSIQGAGTPMPSPVHRYRPLVDADD